MDDENNDCPMELRILKDGRVVLVAPDTELLEAIELIITNQDTPKTEVRSNDRTTIG